MAAEDCLRLAWEADHDGRRKLRDSLLTLAVIDSGPEDHWAERCRARLIADRPEHFLAGFPTVGQALADPRVVVARQRLRIKFPPARVAGLLLKARAARGTYTGRQDSLAILVEDLAGPPAAEADNLRRHAPEPARGPIHHLRTFRAVPSGLEPVGQSYWNDEPEPLSTSETDRETAQFALKVLYAIALLHAIIKQQNQDVEMS